MSTKMMSIVSSMTLVLILEMGARAGNIKISDDANGSSTVSSDNQSIIACAVDNITLEATCTNGTLTATYTPSSSLDQSSDNGSGTTDETTTFSVEWPEAGVAQNTILCNLGHVASNASGGACLPAGDHLTFNVFVPELDVSFSNWSSGDYEVGFFGESEFGNINPPIGLASGSQPQLNSGGQLCVPCEYKSEFAPDISSYKSFDKTKIGISETSERKVVEYPTSGSPKVLLDTSTTINYNSGPFCYMVCGTDTDPVAYACDAPGN